MAINWDYFCDVVADEMGCARSRISWSSLIEHIPESEREDMPHIRIDFDGGMEEYHLCAIPFNRDYESAVFTGRSFMFMLKDAVEAVENGTWKPRCFHRY